MPGVGPVVAALRSFRRLHRGRLLIVCVGLGIAVLIVLGGIADAAWSAPGDALARCLDDSHDRLQLRDSCPMLLALCAFRDSIASRTLSSTSEPAYAVSQDGLIVAWNKSAEAAFGYTATQAVGRKCWDLLAGQDVFDNRYCCQGCPIREMAFCHEPIKGSTLTMKTAMQGRRKYDICMLLVCDSSGTELLVHLCHPAREAADARPGAAPAGPTPAYSGHRALTPREVEILALLADGLETREIASELCISVATARNHLQHVLRKLRAHSRVAAIARGRKLGLV
ncbi:MAG TPA: LuxR C-terminal-related transcriptional regulator [Steroidobacteraceae bacterium]|nr:LuxR C-terminal-related transcriptional regulator [Steroidobacteraceae bacterium]